MPIRSLSKTKSKNGNILSATVATATKSISRAINIINNQNNDNQAAELRILNLDKQLLHQKHTSNEIINHQIKQITPKKLKNKSSRVDDLSHDPQNPLIIQKVN